MLSLVGALLFVALTNLSNVAALRDADSGDRQQQRRQQNRRRLPLGHLPEPTLRWETRLPNSGTEDSGKPGPRQYNAVQLSPDGTHLYVTLDDGTLHILDAQSNTNSTGAGTVVASYRPPAVTDAAANAPPRAIACVSGVSFSDSDSDAADGTDGAYAVYAVIDVPVDATALNFIPTTSRVVAVDHPTGRVRWVSPVLEGAVAGTPRIGTDGRYVYLTRNVEINAGFDQDGHFTLLDAQAAVPGSVAYTHPSSAFRGGNETGPYAPLELVRNPTSGNFGVGDGNANRNDVAAWAQSNGGGTTLNGMSLAFQFPSNADLLAGGGAWSPYLLKVNGWSTATRPTLSSDGQNLYFTASKASLRGWNTRFGRRASWKAEQLDASPRNGRAALAAAAILSVDERSLFVGSGSNSFYSLDAYSGLTNWRVGSDSPFVAEARASPDGRRVYSIERANGKITARDATTGQAYWSVTCGTYDAANPFCQYNVEAEFDLSADGYTLYYADVLGMVRALAVGYDAPPSPAPTRAPTVPPTPVPSRAPVAGPDPTAEPSAEPTTAAPTLLTDEPTRRPTDPPTPEPRDTEPPSGAGRLSSTLMGLLTATVGFVFAFGWL